MDIRQTDAARAYASARATTAVAGHRESGREEPLRALARDFVETVRAGEDTARAAMVGSADPHALVQALTASQLAIETAVTVRDKVVEAYQEILRMPV